MIYRIYRPLFIVILNIVILNIAITAYPYTSQDRRESMTRALDYMEYGSVEYANNEGIVYQPETTYQEPLVVEEIDYTPPPEIIEPCCDEIPPDKPYYVKARGKRTHVDRREDFALGNYVDFAAAVSSAFDPISFSLDDWGWGYGVGLGTKEFAPFTFEANFEQSFISFEENRTIPNSISGGSFTMPVMPFIDENHGTLGNGFALNLDPALSPGSYTFEYDMNSYSANILSVYDLHYDNGFTMTFVGGPSWMRFSQRYKVDTSGRPIFIPGSTTSTTEERLIDDLWGVRLGVEGRKKFGDRFSIALSGMGDFFYRYSKFKGTQDYNNALTSDGLQSASLEKKLTDTGFTPHLTSEIDFSYRIFPTVTLSLFYQFDYWWNLTHINNPTINYSVGFFLPGSGPITIEEENVSAQSFGGEVIVIF